MIEYWIIAILLGLLVGTLYAGIKRLADSDVVIENLQHSLTNSDSIWEDMKLRKDRCICELGKASKECNDLKAILSAYDRILRAVHKEFGVHARIESISYIGYKERGDGSDGAINEFLIEVNRICFGEGVKEQENGSVAFDPRCVVRKKVPLTLYIPELRTHLDDLYGRCLDELEVNFKN